MKEYCESTHRVVRTFRSLSHWKNTVFNFFIKPIKSAVPRRKIKMQSVPRNILNNCYVDRTLIILEITLLRLGT